MAFFLQVVDELHGAALAVFFGLEGRAFARIFQHGQVMQRNVGAAPGVGRGGQVVGIGLAGHLEHGHGDGVRHFGAAGEPFGVGPALDHFFGVRVTGLGFEFDVMEKVKHQQRLFQRGCGNRGHFGVVKQIDQRLHVVAAHHGAQQLGGFGLGDQGHGKVAMRHSGQKRGFDLGSVVHARWHAVGQHVEQKGFVARSGRLDQLDQFSGLLGVQRQRGDSQRGALGNMGSVSVQHGLFSLFNQTK